MMTMRRMLEPQKERQPEIKHAQVKITTLSGPDVKRTLIQRRITLNL